MFPCEMGRYIAGFPREARKYGPFSAQLGTTPLTVPRDGDTIDRCISRFWVKFPTLRPSLSGLESVKSPGCGGFMGAAVGESARGLPARSWLMALSSWLNYIG